MDWGKKWLVDFNAGKTQLVSFDWSNNNGSIDVKMDGLNSSRSCIFCNNKIISKMKNWFPRILGNEVQ